MDEKTQMFPSIKKYCELASKLKIGLSLGGFPEVSSVDPGKVFNTHNYYAGGKDILACIGKCICSTTQKAI